MTYESVFAYNGEREREREREDLKVTRYLQLQEGCFVLKHVSLPRMHDGSRRRWPGGKRVNWR